MMRLTQSNATAQRFGHAQVFEKSFVEDLRGKVISLSARVRMSVAATLRWAVCEWTGTADSPTKDVVNDWTSATFTAGNFFLSSNLTVVGTGSLALPANTLTTVVSHAIGTVSGALNNLVILFWTDQAQAQNVTLDVAKVQLEAGKSATAFEGRRTAEELTLCQRYFIVLGGSSNGNLGWGMPVTTTGCNSCCVNLPTIMRKAPTVSQSNMQMYDGSSHTISSLGSAFYSGSSVAVDVTSTGLTVGRPAALVTATNGTMTFNARI